MEQFPKQPNILSPQERAAETSNSIPAQLDQVEIFWRKYVLQETAPGINQGNTADMNETELKFQAERERLRRNVSDALKALMEFERNKEI